MTKGIVKIHGRNYKTVAHRVAEFHANRTDTQCINTTLIYHDESKVIMHACVLDGDKIIGSGYAEEFREDGRINKTSALENAETSAIGRALACIGLGGEEYASADEVLRAIDQQERMGEKEEKQPEPQWDDTPEDEIPDDILDVVKENYGIIHKRWGNGNTWHRQILSNYLSTEVKEGEKATDVIKKLDKQKLWQLSKLQNDKIKLRKDE